MSGFGDKHDMENTDTMTTTDPCAIHALIGPAIVLMAVVLIIILAAIGIGIYFATVNWDRATNWMDETFQNLMEKVTPILDHFTQEEEEESNPKIKTIKQHSCQFESDL